MGKKKLNLKNKFEITTFYCQIDTYLGRKDYLRGGRCVRLIGVNKSDYYRLIEGEHHEGVRTFIIDIDASRFPSLTYSKSEKSRISYSDKAKKLEQQLNDESHWYEINIEIDNLGYSYFYPTFSQLPPTRFTVKHIKPTKSPSLDLESENISMLLKKMPTNDTAKLKKLIECNSKNLTFSAFHVGQGMCSIAYNSDFSVMFDAGAGTPITRKRYLAGLKKNDLQSLVERLESVPYLVLSHFDNDHWNLLAWSQLLTNSVKNIIVPKVKNRSKRSVAFFDKKIKNKVIEASNIVIKFKNNKSSIEIQRTSPQKSDNNGHCLVSVINIEGKHALAAGDYVYSRMLTDNEPLIKDWHSKKNYSALIVPHHGDEASAYNIPPCATNAVAFFSAGNHKTYNHPRPHSVDVHKKAGFRVVVDKNQQSIIEKKLL